MSPRLRGLLAVLVTTAFLGAAGCATGQDDELARPTRTITTTPSPRPAAAPGSIPVGHGDVSTGDVVWGEGNTLHIGDRSVNLAPVAIDQLVVVPGGVFVRSGSEVWFTDLARLRPTGFTRSTGVATSANGDQLLITDSRSGRPTTYAFDPRSGGVVSPAGSPAPTNTVNKPLPVSQVDNLPAEFELKGWVGDTSFYGVASKDGRPATVVRCDEKAGTCTTLGEIQGDNPLVFAQRP